jgi:hypothetical protein
MLVVVLNHLTIYQYTVPIGTELPFLPNSMNSIDVANGCKFNKHRFDIWI